jgi:hypothetical protein
MLCTRIITPQHLYVAIFSPAPAPTPTSSLIPALNSALNSALSTALSTALRGDPTRTHLAVPHPVADRCGIGVITHIVAPTRVRTAACTPIRVVICTKQAHPSVVRISQAARADRHRHLQGVATRNPKSVTLQRRQAGESPTHSHGTNGVGRGIRNRIPALTHPKNLVPFKRLANVVVVETTGKKIPASQKPAVTADATRDSFHTTDGAGSRARRTGSYALPWITRFTTANRGGGVWRFYRKRRSSSAENRIVASFTGL